MPTWSGGICRTNRSSAEVPKRVALSRRTTWNSAGLMRYVPAVRMPIWRPRWPPRAQELRRVLEAVARDFAAEDLVGRHGGAVRGDDEGDFARRDDHERHALHLVEPVPVAEVPAGGQQVGLQARLTVEGDEREPAGSGRPKRFTTRPAFALADDAKAEGDEAEGEEDDGRAADNPQTPRRGCARCLPARNSRRRPAAARSAPLAVAGRGVRPSPPVAGRMPAGIRVNTGRLHAVVR